jgi:hypothetical protein
MLFVQVLVLDATRMRSPELAPPQPSAPPRCAPSLPHLSRPRLPSSLLRATCFVPVPSALKTEPLARDRRSSPERRLSATAHRPAAAVLVLACMRSRRIEIQQPVFD